MTIADTKVVTVEKSDEGKWTPVWDAKQAEDVKP